MEEVISSLELTGGLIKRSVENFKKLGAAHINPANINKRLELVKGYWDEARALHLKLVTTMTDDVKKEHAYFKHNQFSLIEEAYEQAVAGFMLLMPGLGQPAPVQAGNATNDALQGNPRSFQLPRLDLPKFSGSYLRWNSFKDQFLSIFDACLHVSNVQKLQLLESCLEGDALLLIESLPTTADNYVAAWNALTDRYENQRLITDAYLHSFISISPLKNRNVHELRNLLDCSNNSIIALTNAKVCNDSWGPILVYLIVSKLDQQTQMEWEFELKSSTAHPTFNQLKDFLNATIRVLESRAANIQRPLLSTAKPNKAAANNSFRSHQINMDTSRCILCKGDHHLFRCDRFKQKSVSNRLDFVKAHRCCINCLSKGHYVSECKSSKGCFQCSQRHHTLLHKSSSSGSTHTGQAMQSSGTSSGNSGVTFPREVPATNGTAHSTSFCSQTVHKSLPCTVLLPTAIVLIRAANGRFVEVRALLDMGSQTTFLSQEIARALDVREERVDARVSAVGDNPAITIRAAVSFSIEPTHRRGPTLGVRALVLPRLTSYASSLMHVSENWDHLRHLKLADPAPQRSGPIELIIGADYLGEILLPEIRRGSAHTPVAQDSIFGWVVYGNYPSSSASISVNHICWCLELDRSVARFWELEDLPDASKLTPEEVECENHFAETHSRAADGRYIVRLPFKTNSDVRLPRSAEIARKFFLKNEARLVTDSDRFCAYKSFIDEYLSLGHMEPVRDQDSLQRGCYLSHHSVWRDSSSTPKLRVVFNASMRTANGKSLNDFLLVGPKLQADLFALICGWRSFRFVLCSDIEKMFRQIWVDPRDVDFQKIFWRNDSFSPLDSFRLLTVTYGTACAPFAANMVIKQLAADEGHRFPRAAEVLRNSVYVDDVLFGADDVESAQNLKLEVCELLTAGGFRLRKWASNSPSLLSDIESRDHGLACDKMLQRDETLRLLGILWNPRSDCFQYQVSIEDIATFTKRTFLSCVLRNFDPLGWVSSVTIQAKILLQVIWTRKLGWDEPLPSDLNSQCLTYYKDLVHSQNVVVPRWTGQTSSTERIALHGFADASNLAYAAIVYLSVGGTACSQISLLAAKTRVAPLKSISIPRLELCAAQLLAKLLRFVCSSMQFTDVPIFCWTDSTVALAWIRSEPSRWKTFVANRVSKIQSLIPTAVWRHVAGKENPADISSRGISAERLPQCELWWQGPSWLKQANEPSAPIAIAPNPSALSELRTEKAVLSISTENLWASFRPVSSWLRLLRITSYCVRFVAHARKKIRVSPDIVVAVDEMLEAEKFWIQRMQKAYFNIELGCLISNKPLTRSSLY